MTTQTPPTQAVPHDFNRESAAFVVHYQKHLCLITNTVIEVPAYAACVHCGAVAELEPRVYTGYYADQQPELTLSYHCEVFTPAQAFLARVLKHLVLHSPTGFGHGYGGSGPADLALSVLADYFGEQDVTPAELYTGLRRTHFTGPAYMLSDGRYSDDRKYAVQQRVQCIAFHQPFKWAKVATVISGARFQISTAEISQFLIEHIRGIQHAAHNREDDSARDTAPRTE